MHCWRLALNAQYATRVRVFFKLLTTVAGARLAIPLGWEHALSTENGKRPCWNFFPKPHEILIAKGVPSKYCPLLSSTQLTQIAKVFNLQVAHERQMFLSHVLVWQTIKWRNLLSPTPTRGWNQCHIESIWKCPCLVHVEWILHHK